MSPEKDLSTIRREKTDRGSTLAVMGGQTGQCSMRSVLLCCEQLRGQSVQGDRGQLGGCRERFQRQEKSTHNPIIAAKDLFALPSPNKPPVAGAHHEDSGCSGRFTRLCRMGP